MKQILLALVAIVAVGVAGDAGAADWTTTEGGSTVCTKINTDGTCYVATAGANTSAISIRGCASWTIIVYGTATSVMPQTCTESSCATAENLLATALTGASPNTFVTSEAPFDLVRLVTTDSITASIKCGR